MSKIAIGDKIYALKDRLDFKEYQIEMIVSEIKIVKLGRWKSKWYVGVLADGNKESSYHTERYGGKNKILVRKRPVIDIPVFTSEQEVSDFIIEGWNKVPSGLAH